MGQTSRKSGPTPSHFGPWVEDLGRFAIRTSRKRPRPQSGGGRHGDIQDTEQLRSAALHAHTGYDTPDSERGPSRSVKGIGSNTLLATAPGSVTTTGGVQQDPTSRSRFHRNPTPGSRFHRDPSCSGASRPETPPRDVTPVPDVFVTLTLWLPLSPHFIVCAPSFAASHHIGMVIKVVDTAP